MRPNWLRFVRRHCWRESGGKKRRKLIGVKGKREYKGKKSHTVMPIHEKGSREKTFKRSHKYYFLGLISGEIPWCFPVIIAHPARIWKHSSMQEEGREGCRDGDSGGEIQLQAAAPSSSLPFPLFYTSCVMDKWRKSTLILLLLSASLLQPISPLIYPSSPQAHSCPYIENKNLSGKQFYNCVSIAFSKK